MRFIRLNALLKARIIEHNLFKAALNDVSKIEEYEKASRLVSKIYIKVLKDLGVSK